MNWSKAKSILILFLVVANLFLAFILVRSGWNSIHIPSETIINTQTILKEHNVSIDTKLLPRKIEQRKIYTVENSISSYSDFAEKVLGKNYILSDNRYYTSEAEVVFSGDFFDINYNGGFHQDTDSNLSEDIAREYLLSLGIDTKSATCSVLENETNSKTVTFTENLGDSPFFSRKVEVDISENKIISANGCWFTKTDAPATLQTIESIPNLLIKLVASNPDFSNTQINEINFGYGIGEEAVFHKSGNVLPMYEIVCTDGIKFYVYAV